jgi:hypothetical protein
MTRRKPKKRHQHRRLADMDMSKPVKRKKKAKRR